MLWILRRVWMNPSRTFGNLDGINGFREWAALMGDTLDVKYVEHDAFALFHRLMGAAKQWYEFKEELRPARIRVYFIHFEAIDACISGVPQILT